MSSIAGSLLWWIYTKVYQIWYQIPLTVKQRCCDWSRMGSFLLANNYFHKHREHLFYLWISYSNPWAYFYSELGKVGSEMGKLKRDRKACPLPLSRVCQHTLYYHLAIHDMCIHQERWSRKLRNFIIAHSFFCTSTNMDVDSDSLICFKEVSLFRKPFLNNEKTKDYGQT